MHEFIIVTKETRLNLLSIMFANDEIIRLLKKKCNVGVFSNDTHFVLVREVDDSIFWDKNYNRQDYVKENAEAIKDILENYPFYTDFPIPKFIN